MAAGAATPGMWRPGWCGEWGKGGTPALQAGMPSGRWGKGGAPALQGGTPADARASGRASSKRCMHARAAH
eukprot:50422-Chlamydomonas_euryale.AAC.1